MTNYEHYKDEIDSLWKRENSFAVIAHKNNRFGVESFTVRSCNGVDCYRECIFHKDCQKGAFTWLNKEYQDPEYTVDWTMIHVDTPILVRNNDNNLWFKGHFAEFKEGHVYTFVDGKTSWTAGSSIESWDCAKLADEKYFKQTKLTQIRKEFSEAIQEYSAFHNNFILNDIQQIIDDYIDTRLEKIEKNDEGKVG